MEHGYKPKLKPLGKDVSQYDEIIVGTPTWWYTMAPAMRSFLSQSKLDGKKIVLFHTHGGWPGYCLYDMEELCGDVEVVSRKSIRFDSSGGDHLVMPTEEIEDWIREIE